MIQFIILIILFSFIHDTLGENENKLENLVKITPSSITISGLSSGAFMSIQFAISHSNLINGAAIFAGGPYYCAESTLYLAESRCMKKYNEPLTTTSLLVDYTKDASEMGTIDNIKNIKNQKFYLYSGEKDSVVDPSVMNGLSSYLSLLEVPKTSIKEDFNKQSEHCMPTIDYGEDCDVLSEPYLGNCNYDGAGNAFKAILKEEEIKNKRGVYNNSNIFEFNQNEFIEKGKEIGINDIGLVYVPEYCQIKGNLCALHVALHGCKQNMQFIKNTFAVHAGYNEWAETNNIVVVYPYAKPTTTPFNPKGCWDWWSYTGVDYGLKSGKQIEFLKKVIDAIIIS